MFVSLDDPLHVSRFYPRARRGSQAYQRRQWLILKIADLHQKVTRRPIPNGMNEVQVSLTAYRKVCRDYRKVLDRFFTVKQQGYKLATGETDISTLTPKRVRYDLPCITYTPPPLPAEGITSKVWLRPLSADDLELIERRLISSSRFDLIEQVRWLASQPSTEVTFYFSPAGALQQRDTSTWPIRAIEAWPKWLRTRLFGGGVDLDSAYTQYIVRHLRVIYAGQPLLPRRLFYHLIRLNDDKHAFRQELLSALKPAGDEDQQLKIVKAIIMGLANGATCSPQLLLKGGSSSVVELVRHHCQLDEVQLIEAGKLLQSISQQFRRARRIICNHHIGMSSSRSNQRRVFEGYFKWEREARYSIWRSIGQVGIMMHDGIDGVPDHLIDAARLSDEVGLKITVG
jgi:hypothetical protein